MPVDAVAVVETEPVLLFLHRSVSTKQNQESENYEVWSLDSPQTIVAMMDYCHNRLNQNECLY